MTALQRARIAAYMHGEGPFSDFEAATTTWQDAAQRAAACVTALGFLPGTARRPGHGLRSPVTYETAGQGRQEDQKLDMTSPRTESMRRGSAES